MTDETKHKLKAVLKKLCERAHADERIEQEGEVDYVFLYGLPREEWVRSPPTKG